MSPTKLMSLPFSSPFQRKMANARLWLFHSSGEYKPSPGPEVPKLRFIDEIVWVQLLPEEPTRCIIPAEGFQSFLRFKSLFIVSGGCRDWGQYEALVFHTLS